MPPKALPVYGLTNTPKPDILISFRMEGKQPGNGAYYDHYTIQHHTGYPTAAVVAPRLSFQALQATIQASTSALPHSPVDPNTLRQVPPMAASYSYGGGLLFIPGQTHDSYNAQTGTSVIRSNFEKTLIRDALNRGRPILAVCAGSWGLWNGIWENTENAPTDHTIAVTDHNYGAGMPRIGVNGTMVNNTMVHDVVITTGSLLQKTMQLSDAERQRPVNSVHWRAPDSTHIPQHYAISATAAQSATIAINTRQGAPMRPQTNIVEAFESIHGAPVLGIGWHPEAFDWKTAEAVPHRKCLLFMAKAGHAFAAKQTMLTEFKAKMSQDDADETLATVFKTAMQLA